MASKKPVKNAAPVKKPAPVKKAASQKKAASAKKPVPQKKASPVEKKEIKRVPIRIARKPIPAVKPVQDPVPEVDRAETLAFAMRIAQARKRAAAEADRREEEGTISLSRRPTTRAQGKQTEKFPESDLKDFRRRLIDAREKATRGASAMRAAGFNGSDDHEADGGDGTNQTLRLQALGQVESINRTLQQIEEALHRIDEGSYGICTACGQLIRKPRLLNQPFVLTCMECQSEMERAKKSAM